MTIAELREQVYRANLELRDLGLVTGTFGNASAINRETGIVAIKPSGISYEELRPDLIVLVGLDLEVIEGDLRPSSDTPTHVVLYRAFPHVGGIAHTHSPYATAWAQGRRDLECLGTTHADYFHGAVPVTDVMADRQISGDYEEQTGVQIVDTFASRGTDSRAMPAVLVACHGPFTWGVNAHEAVFHSQMLEYVAYLNTLTRHVSPETEPLTQTLLDKHFLRKHGRGAYYGQT